MTYIRHTISVVATTVTLMFGSAAPARDVTGPSSTYFVVIHHADLHPPSAKAARAMLNRLDAAALEACGASSFSLREMKVSVRASKCWKDSLAEVITRINDPKLYAAYERGRGS